MSGEAYVQKAALGRILSALEMSRRGPLGRRDVMRMCRGAPEVVDWWEPWAPAYSKIVRAGRKPCSPRRSGGRASRWVASMSAGELRK